MRYTLHATLISLLLLSGCASMDYAVKSEASTETKLPAAKEDIFKYTANQGFAAIQTSDSKMNKDRAAILAMHGEYKVGFEFKETVVLASDYELRPPKQSGAFEAVVVIENSPEKIVLQHLLVVGGGHVIKHWRQDWTYEADERFEFVEDQTWQVKTLSSTKKQGSWTQCVFEVSDAPRYCGTGLWNHRYGVSTWTSDRTWRPLPRREYTTRKDYNALNVENRHTITPQGWTHEQDNTKTMREGRKTSGTLVREFGFNNYRSIEGYDFSPAYLYWEKTANYWQRIRRVWGEQFSTNGIVSLKTEVDGMPIINETFSHADSIQKEAKEPSQKDIQKIFNEWVSTELN